MSNDPNGDSERFLEFLVLDNALPLVDVGCDDEDWVSPVLFISLLVTGHRILLLFELMILPDACCGVPEKFVLPEN